MSGVEIEGLARHIKTLSEGEFLMDIEKYKKMEAVGKPFSELCLNTRTDELVVLVSVHDGDIYIKSLKDDSYSVLKESSASDLVVLEQYSLGEVFRALDGSLYEVHSKYYKDKEVESAEDIVYVLHEIGKVNYEDIKVIRKRKDELIAEDFIEYKIPNEDEVFKLMTVQETLNEIRNWAFLRNLQTADPQSQVLKLLEEAGEIVEGIEGYDMDEILDGIGDMVVVLTVLSTQVEDVNVFNTISIEVDISEIFGYDGDREEINTLMLSMLKRLGELASSVARGKVENYEEDVAKILRVLSAVSHEYVQPYYDSVAEDEERESLYAKFGDNLPSMLGVAIKLAYNEIKNRKGKMINGVFVKEDDLKG